MRDKITSPDTATTPLIVADKLGKQVTSSTGVLTILADISFQVTAGESLAVIGASGSGKTTLLGLLAGLDVPGSGRVVLQGQDLNQLDEDGRAALRAQQVGFVFQAFHLLPSMSALENVMLPLELAGADNVRQSASDILNRVGLGERLHHYPPVLSGGEQQRVALARAFAAKPAILFADEPTGSLDTQTGEHIIDQLFELNRQFGTTLVMVTHDPALAKRCDRSLRLTAGRLDMDMNLDLDTTAQVDSPDRVDSLDKE